MGDPRTQKYCSGTSHCVAAGKVHLLVYTNDVPEHRKQAATRRREIEARSSGHTIIEKCVNDFGKLKEAVNEAAAFGQICEFAVWSHAAFDGTISKEEVSRSSDQCFHLNKQLYLEEWGDIDFNWAENSFAAFYGCRTAMAYQNGSAVVRGEPDPAVYDRAFARKFLELHPSLSAAAGQPWYTYPSVYNTGKSWEISGYSEGEGVYSIAWRGDKHEHGGGLSLNPWESDAYWPGVPDKIRAIAWYDEGFRMRVFRRSENGRGVFRAWPNITPAKIEAMEVEPTPQYPNQAAALEESVNRDGY